MNLKQLFKKGLLFTFVIGLVGGAFAMPANADDDYPEPLDLSIVHEDK